MSLSNLLENYFKQINFDNKVADTILYYIVIGLFAILIFTIGWWLINKLLAFLDEKLDATDRIDKTLKSFIRNLLHFGLRGSLVLLVLNIIGIQTTSIVAIFGAASFAVGLALQGSLSNFASGVLILIFKPFRVGDVIEAYSKTGRVKEIQLFNTILVSQENKVLIIPNSKLTGEILINYSKLGNTQSDIEFKMDATVHLDEFRKKVMAILQQMPEVVNYPTPEIYIKEFNTKEVTLLLRFNIATGHSTAVVFKVKEKVFFLLKEETKVALAETMKEEAALKAEIENDLNGE